MAGLLWFFPLFGFDLDNGITEQLPAGTEIIATADGVAGLAEFRDKGYGNMILVRHNRVYISIMKSGKTENR